MPERILIHGPHDRVRLPLLLEWLSEQRWMDTRRFPVLVFVPTEQRARQLRRLISAQIASRIVTFQEFMRQHDASILGERRFLSEQDQVVLLRQILLERPPSFFTRLPRSWGVASAVAKVLSLVRSAADAETERAGLFRQVAEGSPETATALTEIDAIYYRYLSEHAMADRDMLRGELVQRWRQEGYKGKYSALVIDGFSFFFTPAQRTLFATLIPNFQSVAVTLAAPQGGLTALQTHRGYQNVLGALQWLQSIGSQWRYLSTPGQPASLTERIQEELFTESARPLPLPPSGDGSFRLIAAPNRREETRIIARIIRQRLDAGSSPHQHSVVTPDDDAYLPMLRELFEEYGLPLPVPYREKLNQVPVLTIVRKWLDGCLDEWTPNRLYDVLVSGWGNCDSERVQRLDRRRREAKIHQPFDPQQWQEAIERMLQQRLLQGDPEREDFIADQDHYEQECAEVASDIQFVDNYLQKATPIRRAASVDVFVDALRQLLCETGIEQSVLRDDGDRSEQIRNRIAYTRFCEILERMQSLFGAIPPAGNVVHACREYLYHQLEYETCPTIPYQEDGIRLTTLPEAASLQHDSLYLLGCIEGVFPARPIMNFLINPDAHERVILPGLNRLPEERFLLQQMIGNAERVVISYPRLVDGQELSPSPFVEEIRMLFDSDGSPQGQDIAPLTSEEAEPLLSVGEVLQRMGSSDRVEGWEQLDLPHGNVDIQLHAERSRQDRDRFSIYDGWLDKAATQMVWKSFRESYYATTLLDEYARCPIRFFFHQVLRLDEPGEVDDEIAPNVRGMLVHRILERFYQENPELRERNPESKQSALETLKHTAEQAMNAYDQEYPNLYWAEDRRALLKGLDEQDEPGILRAWLELEWSPEEEQLTGEPTPSHFEYRFGPFYRKVGDGEALRLPRLTGPDIRIRGKIDRIDREDGYFAVYDYKTGATPRVRDIERGLSFQLVIYLLALEANGLGEPAAAAYYLLSRADQVRKMGYVGNEIFLIGKGRRPHKFYPDDQFEALKEWTIANIYAIDRHIEFGRFHPSLRDENDAGCRYCSYSQICRYEANRQLNMRLHPDACYAPKPFGADA